MRKDITDLMPENVQGNYELIDATVEGEAFSTFSGGIILGKRTLFRNVIIRNCQVRGRCNIWGGAVLENVTFENIGCYSMNFDIRTVLKGVKIVGKGKPQILRVKYIDPLNTGEKRREGLRNTLKSRHFDADESLDVSEYEGDMEIAGFPSGQVKINPQRHVVIRSALKTEVPWNELGIPKQSTWRDMAMSNPECVDGVFSMPDRSEPDYAQHMAELEILRSKGFVD